MHHSPERLHIFNATRFHPMEQAVEVRAENGRIVIEPAAPTYNLDELLDGITANNLHDEQDFGLSQGKELL